MAIHIRPRTSPMKEEHSRRRRARVAALLAAFLLIILTGTTLYLIIINLPQEHGTSFISYTPPPEVDDFDDMPLTREISSSSAASAAQNISPVIIVSTGASDFSLPMPDYTMEGDFDSFGSGITLGEGIGPASLGNGIGRGGDGQGRGTGNGSGSGAGRHGKGSNDDIQVVIVLDASGSMDQLFTTAAASLEQMLNMLNSCRLNGRPAKVNLGIVAYGQQKNEGAPWTVSKFSKNVKDMSKRVSEVACDGSEEHCGEAIQYALKEFPWNMREREQILKVIFIAGNEPFNQGPVDYHKALAKAREMGVIVNTIHCGPQEQDWADAALEGGGESFSIDFQGPDTSSPQERFAAVKALYNCKAVPTGSPADIEREELELRKRPSLPNEKLVDKWLSKNQQMLVNGFDWDAVELCRRMGEEFSLEMVGGLANLPQGVRAMGEDRALQFIRDAAQARQNAIDDFKDKLSGGSAFCTSALEALRKQAAHKGIDIEL